MLTSEQIFDNCWLFIRGDMEVSEFENWVYGTPELESSFTEEFYMNLISLNYTLADAVFVLKRELKNELNALVSRECECHTLPYLADVGMGQHDHIFNSLDEKAKFGQQLWWLWLAQCSVCQEYWMIGSEERINDVFIMKRLSTNTALGILQNDQWPDDFKDYRVLLRTGRDRGHSVRFVDSVSPALVQTVIDLANANRGIGLKEISTLLQVAPEQARAIVKVAEEQAGFSIFR